MAWLSWCKVTLVTFVWLFFTVCYQLSPQIAFPRGCVVTLVAFVWLFSSVCFQMSFQSAWLRGCKVTLVALICLFSNAIPSHWNCTISFLLNQFQVIQNFEPSRAFNKYCVLHNSCFKLLERSKSKWLCFGLGWTNWKWKLLLSFYTLTNCNS